MTESYINAVISIRQLAEGEISSNKQTSLRQLTDRGDSKRKLSLVAKSKS